MDYMNKNDFFATLFVGLIAGFYIGYTKAREKFLEAQVKNLDK